MRVATFQRSWPQAAYFSWGMLMGLGKEVQEADVVHVHSSWTFPVWWGAWLALRHKKTLVMSPHGAFNPLQLKHSAWKKRLVGGMDRWLLRRASVIHATCEAEAEWVRDFLKSEAGGQRSASFANRASTFANTLPADKTAARVAVGSSSRQRGADETPVRQSATIVVIPNGVEGRDK